MKRKLNKNRLLNIIVIFISVIFFINCFNLLLSLGHEGNTENIPAINISLAISIGLPLIFFGGKLIYKYLFPKN